MKTRKFTALLLVLCLLLTATPYSAPVHAVEEEHLAQEQTQEQTQVEAQTSVEDFDFAVEPKDPEQLQAELDELTYEVTRLREENVKHFHLSDGTYQAVVYGTPVHRKDAEGNWIDIDNSLSDSGAMIVTSDARVKFAKKITGNENILTLHDGNYKITFGLNNAVKKTEATYTNNESADAENKTKLQKLTNLENLSATIVYQDILEGIDLEYVLISNSIKENIIVKSTSDEYCYSFTLELNGLWAELSNNAVYLYDKDTGELTYEIPQPYMYDAAGTASTDVVYDLSDSGNGKYTLTIEADTDWINDEERSFPVVIDPYIRDIAQTADTYVSSIDLTANFGSATDLWIKNSFIAYYRFATPTVPDTAAITSAFLEVPYYYHVVNNDYLQLSAYQVKSNWNEYSITWNNRPEKGSTILGTANVYANGAIESDPDRSSINVTSYVKSWYTGTANYGFALQRTGGNNQSVLLVAREKAQVYARLTIHYSSSKLGDGVYAIQKQGAQTYIKTTRGATNPITQETTHTSPPVSSSDLDNLFKISYRPEYDDYVIRSMVDNELVLYGSTSTISVSTLNTSVSDTNISSAYTWKLIPSSGAYYIAKQSGNTVYYLRSSSTANGAVLTLSTNANASGTLWAFNMYTGSLIEDIEWSNFLEYMAIGDMYTYDAYMRSTRIGHNGPVSFSVSNLDRTATDKATITSTSGFFRATKSGHVRINFTYPGGPWIWYWFVTITPDGCREYEEIEEGGQNSDTVNCQGYAFGTYDLPDWLPDDDYYLSLLCDTSNELLYGVNSFAGYKQLLEDYWLDQVFYNRWEQVYSAYGGLDIEVGSNQWLVAFRVGTNEYATDYHFWYRTDTGQWANKHGFRTSSGSELLDELPNVNSSPGWKLDNFEQFYNSDIIYYVITEGS